MKGLVVAGGLVVIFVATGQAIVWFAAHGVVRGEPGPLFVATLAGRADRTDQGCVLGAARAA